ncbi:MAG: type I secretion system permease/ATPase [Rhodospirillaceae bacterium]|nr:type I secretion system permease/ATPase [Rhodospirillales bacterium]
MSAATVPPDGALLAFVTAAGLFDIVIDSVEVRHALGNPTSALGLDDVAAAAGKVGLAARLERPAARRLQRTPAPAIAEMADGRFLILAKVDDGGVLVHDPVANITTPLGWDAFVPQWGGRLVTLARAGRASSGRFGLGWLVMAASKYRRLFAEALIASLVLQLFALASPMIFQVIIDKVLVHRSLSTLDVLALALLSVALFEAVLTALRSYLVSHTSSRLDAELGATLFERLAALPMSYFETRRVGESVARMRELETVRGFLTGSATTLAVDGVFTIVFILVMLAYSPALTAVVVLAIPLYLGISLVATPMLKRRIDERAARAAESQALMTEFLSGIETVKSMAVEPRMRRRFEEEVAGSTAAAFRSSQLNSLAGQAVGLISKLTTVLILWLGARLVMEGGLSVGQLIAFNMLAGRVAAPILRVVQVWQDFQQTRVSIARLAEIMDTPTEGDGIMRASPLPISGGITFDHVTFRYRPGGPEVLSDLGFSIEPGEVVGLVGASGSGKSTVAKLFQRLHVPERGRVLIDGLDVAQASPSWLRRQIGVVLQDCTLFYMSVRENIALTDPAMPLDKVVEVAKLAGAHDFIVSLPQGYDTIVGERGATLSGGQRQRLAIARALAVDPRILILDEATSALDSEAERAIQANMRRICQGRTVLVIAHRLSTLRFADRILTLEDGRLIEQGSHHELLRQGGRYAHLHAIQTEVHVAE